MRWDGGLPGQLRPPQSLSTAGFWTDVEGRRGRFFPPPRILASCTAGASLKQLQMAEKCKTAAFAFLPTKTRERGNPFPSSVNEQIQQIRK
jgi:hypothetical protein